MLDFSNKLKAALGNKHEFSTLLAAASSIPKAHLVEVVREVTGEAPRPRGAKDKLICALAAFHAEHMMRG
jgi:hypothetical protein